jgi:hypothetical protein
MYINIRINIKCLLLSGHVIVMKVQIKLTEYPEHFTPKWGKMNF